MAERHARQHHVVDITPAAAQQPRILEPRHRLAQRKFTHIALSTAVRFPSAERVDYRNPLDLPTVPHVCDHTSSLIGLVIK